MAYHQDEVRTRRHILGGLTSAYKDGRVSSVWGRRMRGKKGQKLLQTKLALQGEMVVDYFAPLDRRPRLDIIRHGDLRSPERTR